MSKKRKLTPSDSQTKINESEVVSYQVFFQDSVFKGLVRPWQEKEIKAFFKDLGLTDKEPSDKYRDALAKY